jgi:hypothetical protein
MLHFSKINAEAQTMHCPFLNLDSTTETGEPAPDLTGWESYHFEFDQGMRIQILGRIAAQGFAFSN